MGSDGDALPIRPSGRVLKSLQRQHHAVYYLMVVHALRQIREGLAYPSRRLVGLGRRKRSEMESSVMRRGTRNVDEALLFLVQMLELGVGPPDAEGDLSKTRLYPLRDAAIFRRVRASIHRGLRGAFACRTEEDGPPKSLDDTSSQASRTLSFGHAGFNIRLLFDTVHSRLAEHASPELRRVGLEGGLEDRLVRLEREHELMGASDTGPE